MEFSSAPPPSHPNCPKNLRNSRCRTVSKSLLRVGFTLQQREAAPVFYPCPMSVGRAGSTFPPVLLPPAFPGQQRQTGGQSRFSPPAFPPAQETSLFSFTNSAWQAFKIMPLMQDLVKESSNGLTGRAEEGWNIWQRREGLIPEEITNYTLLFIDAKKVG